MGSSSIGDRTRLDLLLLRSLEGRAEAAVRDGHDIGSMVGLLLADVAVETATRLALVHVAKQPSDGDNLQQMLRTLIGIKPDLSAHENPIARLRKARNPVQHGGSIPAASVVVLHVRAMRAFLADLATVAFGVELHSVSAVDFVNDPGVQTALREAIDALDAGDLNAAVSAAASAFEQYRIVWGRWTRRALGITAEDESVHPRTISQAAATASVERALEPRLEDDSWQAAAAISIGLPVPLLARWRQLVRLADGTDEAGEDTVTADQLRSLIDRLALVIWSAESAHPELMDGDER